MTDVSLLTEDADGTVAVPNLALTFSVEGIELDKAGRGPGWDRRWDELEVVARGTVGVLPDGGNAVAMVIVERDGGRGHRFVLAADDADLTEVWIGERAEDPGLRVT